MNEMGGVSCRVLNPVIFLLGISAIGVVSCEYVVRSDSGGPAVLELASFGTAGMGRDDTAVFQAAFTAASSSRQTLHVAASPAPYQVQPLSLPSNLRVLLDSGVVIQATPGYSLQQKLIEIANVSNVSIIGHGAILRMLRKEYTSGEYRHCIEIQGASNIRLRGITCSDSGGDGLYVGSGAAGYSSNIVVEDCTFFNHRRQGLTITSGSDIYVRHCSFLRSNGSAPETGIDLEPNGPGDRLQKIRIEDSITAGNQGDGVGIALGALTANSLPVDIAIMRHHADYNQGSGFMVSYEVNGTKPGVPGTIIVDGSTSVGNGAYGAVASFFSSSGPLLTFQDLAVYDANQRRVTYDNAAVAVKRGGGGIGPEGNVYFLNPTIMDTTGKLDYYYSLRDYSNVGFAHVQIIGTFNFSGAAHKEPYGLVQGQGVDAVSIP